MQLTSLKQNCGNTTLPK